MTRWEDGLPDGWAPVSVMRWSAVRGHHVVVRIRDGAGVVRFEGTEAKARAWVRRGCAETVAPEMPAGWSDGNAEEVSE